MVATTRESPITTRRRLKRISPGTIYIIALAQSLHAIFLITRGYKVRNKRGLRFSASRNVPIGASDVREKKQVLGKKFHRREYPIFN